MYRGTNTILRAATNNVTHAAQTFPGTTYFGYDPNSSTRRLNGALDEVALFNRSLNAAEVSALFGSAQTNVPTVSLTSPVDGAVFPPNVGIALNANVTTNGHAISKVQFFDSTTLLGEDASSPYSVVWSGATIGSHNLSARLLFDTGEIFSATNRITVWDATPPGLSVSLNGANLDLMLTGLPGQHYRIEVQPAVSGPWQTYTDIPALAASPAVVVASMTNLQQFFRAVGLP